MSSAAENPILGRNTATSDDVVFAANPLSSVDDEVVSNAGSVDDQNNLIENNLLPGELNADLHDGKRSAGLGKAGAPPGVPSIFGAAVHEVESLHAWSSVIVNWRDFNNYDRSAAATRRDPIKTSAVDWLLSFAPDKQLSNADGATPSWEPVGWGGYPNLALAVDRVILAAVDAPEAANHDKYLVDRARISMAWPAVGNTGSPYKPSELRGRPSMKHYHASVSPQILNKITQTLDPTTAKFWQTSLQLRNEADAMWILRYRAKGAQVGDNHLPLLVAAWQYYFDAIAANANEMVCSKRGQRHVGYAYNIYKDTNWVSAVGEQGKEIVNCIGMPQDYATFWALCCLPTQELFAAKTNANGITYETPFGAWRRRFRTQMCVISEHTVIYPATAPGWWSNPNLILSFIEMYSMKFGLDEQVNDALYVALTIPLATCIGTPLTVPEPVHSKDWFEGMVEPGEGLDPIRQLHLSSPTAVTAAWATAPQVMVGVLSELVDVELSEREGIAVQIATFSSATRALALALQRPGAFTATILSKILNLPTTALELAGLNNAFVPVGSLIPPVLWTYRALSLWQHQLVPVRNKFGYLAVGPQFGRVWFPSYRLTPAHLVVTSTEYQLLRRFRVLENNEQTPAALADYDVPANRLTAKLTIPMMEPTVRQRLALILKFGLSLTDIGPQETQNLVIPERDPAEAVELYNSWQYAGICPTVAGSDTVYGGRRSNSLKAKTNTVANSTALLQAIRDAEVRQLELRQSIFEKLKNRGPKISQTSQMVKTSDDEVLYQTGSGVVAPETPHEVCGWEIIVAISASLPTVASAKRAIARVLGRDPNWEAKLPDMLSTDELATIARILKLDVMLVEHDLENRMIKSVVVGEPTYECVAHLDHAHWSLLSTYPAPRRDNAPDNDLRTSSSSETAGCNGRMTSKEKAVAYELAIQKFNAAAITKEQLIETHTLIFPERTPPKSMEHIKVKGLRVVGRTAAETAACSCGCAELKKNTKQLLGRLHELLGCQELYPNRNETTRQKNNIRPRDVLLFIQSNIVNMRNTDETKIFCAAKWMLGHVGQAAEFVVSVACWVLVNTITPEPWSWLWAKSGAYKATEDTWLEVVKPLHDRLRKHGYPAEVTATESDWTQSLYLQALYGRGGVIVDWAEEFRNKTTPPAAIRAWDGMRYSEELAEQIIRDEIEEVVATAYPKALPQTFDRFMDNAYEWLVSGSTAGLPSVLKNSPLRDLILRDYGLSPRPTKRSVMEAIPRQKVLDILLNTSPKIVAKAHMKLNETGGKARAIYGVTMWHYIFSNWLLAPVEKHLDHKAVDINLDGSAMLTATLERLGQVEAGMVFNSYDYPDFNSMHTHANMARIYAAAKHASATHMERERGTRYSDEDRALILAGFDWLEAAVYHQYVLHPDTGAIIPTSSGLYSGNRDTTLINTLLNIAYAKVVDISLTNKYVKPGVITRLCHGDDIITVHRSLPGAMLWNDEASACNLKGQETKLMIDHHHHEYLRIMGCSDGTLRGCLARCVATYVNGNWETDRIVGVWAKLQEAASSMATWVRRGAELDTVQQLWNISRYRALQQQFGFSAKDARQLNIRDARPAQNKAEPEYGNLPSHVTGPYITSIAQQLPQDLRPTPKEMRKLKRVLQKSTYGTELPLQFQQTDLTKVSVGAVEAVRNLGSEAGRHYRARAVADLKLTGTSKTDWQLRNRVKAFHHLLGALDLKSRQLSRIEVISELTGASKPSVARILEADAELARSGKNHPNWHLPAELASTITELEWAVTTSAGEWPETLLGTSALTDTRRITDITVNTSTYNRVTVGSVLRY